jgi:hypothetical protein
MAVRFAFARRGLLAAAITVASACATPPPPLPPRRVAFAANQPRRVAPPPDLDRAAEPPVRHERYLGWTLGADLLSLVPLTSWMFRPEDVYLALPSLVLPPAIHVAHGESRTAAISFLMRGAMIGGVYLAGRSAEEECEDSETFVCVPMGSFLLAELAIIPVVLVDAFFLARTTGEVEGWHRLPVLPSVSPTPGGGVLSLTRRF